MDRVRFGRALGSGLRAATKAAVQAANAAAAPDPRATSTRNAAQAVEPGFRQARSPKTAGSAAVGVAAARAAAASPEASGRAGRGGGAALRGVSAPLKTVGRNAVRVSGVVMLEVAGTLFAVLALSAAVGAWHGRAALSAMAAPEPHRRELVTCGVALLFAWFTLSSFLRARRRSRQG